MKILCWVMFFFGFLNTALAQDVTGTWSLANGHKAEWLQDGQNVYCVYNGGDFKHYLSGRFTSTNQIEAQVVRINLGNNCRTAMAIRYTVSGNSLTESWTANDSNCDLQRGQTGGGILTRTTPSTRPMNPFGGSAYNPESDLTGAWGDDQGYGDWIQDERNAYYIFNNDGFKHYFSGVITGNSISGTLIRINRQNNCRTILRATYTKTGTNTLQYTWVANDGNCDIALGQRGEGTITRKGSRSNVTVTATPQVFQTEVQYTINVSGATPNSVVIVDVVNIPSIANRSCRIQINSAGNGSCVLIYPFTVSWCSLTIEQQRQNSLVMVTDEQSRTVLARREQSFSSVFSRPVGGVCTKRLSVDIVTGGDDLRGRSQAYITLHYSGGSSSNEMSLNNGAGWGNNSSNNFSVDLDARISAQGIVGMTIRVDGEPRSWTDTYDNWNVDKIRVALDGAVLWNLSGTPLIRFTGATRQQRWNR